MSRMPRWLVPVLVVLLAVTSALAADAQPQTVHFVAHLVVFMPKNAAELGQGKLGPPLGPEGYISPYLDQEFRGDTKAADGYMMRTPVAELLPDPAPAAGLDSRDPEVVAKALRQIDDRWDYKVLTLSGEGRVGALMVDRGQLGPVALKATNGADLGTDAADRFGAMAIVRVSRLLDGGYALVQSAVLLDIHRGDVRIARGQELVTVGRGSGVSAPRSGSFSKPDMWKLGAATVHRSRGVRLAPAGYGVGGDADTEVVEPGYLVLLTIGTGNGKP